MKQILSFAIDCFNNSSYNPIMTFLRRLRFITVLCSLLFSVTTAQATLIDRIAGVIDGEVITYSDLEIERIFKLSDGEDRDVLQYLIDRRLLLKEAEKFKITESEEDLKKVQQRLLDIKIQIGEDQFQKQLEEYSLAEQDILKRLKDKVLVEKFIDFRINFFIVISDDAIKAYYNEHKDEFADNESEVVHGQIKERLFQAESKRRLEDYLGQLRRKAKISVNL